MLPINRYAMVGTSVRDSRNDQIIANITAMVPGLSAMGAVLLLGEPLHWNLVVGLLLVTGGILFGVRAAAQRA